MSSKFRDTISIAIHFFVASVGINVVNGRGYQPGSKVGDGYGQESVWSNEHGIPVWASLLISIFVISVVIVSCCCYRKCRRPNNEKWIGLPTE